MLCSEKPSTHIHTNTHIYVVPFFCYILKFLCCSFVRVVCISGPQFLYVRLFTSVNFWLNSITSERKALCFFYGALKLWYYRITNEQFRTRCYFSICSFGMQTNNKLKNNTCLPPTQLPHTTNLQLILLLLPSVSLHLMNQKWEKQKNNC